MTKFILLIGYPLKHSVSPIFQQAALDYYHLDICYQAQEVVPGQLKAVVESLKDPNYLGANVTVPHKEEVLSLLDGLDELADSIGAVNTIVRRDNKLIGYNTDAQGFLRALTKDGKFNPKNKHAIIFGAGGGARAVSFSLLKAGLSSLTIINRTYARAEALATSLKRYVTRSGLKAKISTLPFEKDAFSERLGKCHLIINCTSIGMKYGAEEGQTPLDRASISKHALVVDLVYNPFETPLLKEAKQVGAQVLGGLPMLIYQGAASFQLWTNKKPPVDIMFKAAQEALSGN